MTLAELKAYVEAVPKSTAVKATTGDFSGNLSVGGTLGVTGATTLAGVTTTGDATIGGALDHNGATAGLYGVAPVARAAAIATPTAPSAVYVQAEAVAMKTAVDAIRTALRNIGITA